MIAEIVVSGGLGKKEVIRLPISQIVLKYEDGTPIYAGAHYGPDRAWAHERACVEQETLRPADFQQILRALGINMTVVVDQIEMPKPPPGARLLYGPRPKKEGE